MPERINRAIELLEQGEPIYQREAGELSYENGRASAKTWADYLIADMEHGALNMPGLGEFMRGLVDGGPTNSGHRTPAVIATVPTDGTDEDVIRANAWMFKQVLATGVHGVLLCHAETPGAVQTFVESCRYPVAASAEGLGDGRRGAGGQNDAAEIWGISPQEYIQEKADAWPLNPGGELMLGIKIENKRAMVYADVTARVPGLAFGEWGPGDMGMSLGYPDAHDPPYPEEMTAARRRVMAACRNAGLFFLNAVSADNIVSIIDEGVMMASCGRDGEQAAKVGREHTKRTMPV